MANIEVTKFANMVSAIGTETLKSMANAGPEMQVRLCHVLKSTEITKQIIVAYLHCDTVNLTWFQLPSGQLLGGSIVNHITSFQAKLLSGLGIRSTLITDGNSPINLFNTANGLIGVGGMVPFNNRAEEEG